MSSACVAYLCFFLRSLERSEKSEPCVGHNICRQSTTLKTRIKKTSRKQKNGSKQEVNIYITWNKNQCIRWQRSVFMFIFVFCFCFFFVCGIASLHDVFDITQTYRPLSQRWTRNDTWEREKENPIKKKSCLGEKEKLIRRVLSPSLSWSTDENLGGKQKKKIEGTTRSEEKKKSAWKGIRMLGKGLCKK